MTMRTQENLTLLEEGDTRRVTCAADEPDRTEPNGSLSRAELWTRQNFGPDSVLSQTEPAKSAGRAIINLPKCQLTEGIPGHRKIRSCRRSTTLSSLSTETERWRSNKEEASSWKEAPPAFC
ncbi:hypothetical protein MHYP_G00275950 [Metynnis hypsauchen]